MHKADTVASHFPKHLLQAAMATWRRAAVERQTISGLQQQVHMFLQTHMKLKPQVGGHGRMAKPLHECLLARQRR